MKFAKKLMAGLLVVAVVVTGVVVMPKTAEAESYTDEKGIMYILDNENYKFSDYWSQRKAPVREDCVFGGWYEKDDEGNYVALKETDLTAEGATVPESAYAKFVPAYVLSVRTQNEAETGENDQKAGSMRVISSVDSRKYKNVGFDIRLDKTIEVQTEEMTEVYSGLLSGTEGNETPQSASDVFGPASSHFSVWRLDGIKDAKDGNIIYVRPYWTTLDGTKVEGLAEYVHFEDDYLDLINVPVNLTNSAAVAAGKVTMTYDSTVLTYKEVEDGMLLGAMSKNDTNAGTIKMVGNITVSEVGTLSNVAADGLYANVRFSVNAEKDIDDAALLVTENEFCNLDEDMQTVTVDITH